MLFNSLEFIIFFLVFFALWQKCKQHNNSRWILITLASIVFYAYWDWRFVFLILFSGFVDYFAGLLLIKSTSWGKAILFFSLAVNLSLLSVFKYAPFFAEIIHDLAAQISLDLQLKDTVNRFSIILPLGISFYTFQSMSYTIDIYRGKLKPTRNIFHFFSYLLMFPQLVAGPIVRAKDLLFQLERTREVSKIAQWHAFQMIVFGLFRKVVIADNLAYLVDAAYEGKALDYGAAFWGLVIMAFTFQIYCDFSGYSLIARGIARLMGYHFKMNFNHPYLAVSFQDFWRRWHISLSTWFRDYVYIPLGGSQKGVINMVFALVATMLISGLWHGANYTFIIWGVLHAIFLLLEKFIKLKMPKPVKMILVFVLVSLSWVYFRASTVAQANTILSNAFNFSNLGLDFIGKYIDAIFFLTLAVVVELWVLFKNQSKSLTIWFKNYHLDVLAVIVALTFIFCFRGEGKQFIYFQF